MSGGRALGHWEVKNCHTFKALAVCKQEVSGTHDTLMPSPHIDLNAPCPTGWESRKGLSHCYKVIQRVYNHVILNDELLFGMFQLFMSVGSCSVCCLGVSH